MLGELPQNLIAAGLVRRGAALLLDLILAAPLGMVAMAGAAVVLRGTGVAELGGLLAHVLVVSLYFAVLPVRMSGRTPGQHALGVWVVDGTTRDIPSAGVLVRRGLFKYLITVGLCMPLSLVMLMIGRESLPDLGGLKGAKSGGKTTVRFLHDSLTNTFSMIESRAS